MFRTLISAAAACATLAGLCLVAPMTANAQIQIVDPNCTAGWALSGTVGSQVLTCQTGGSGPPTGCSISVAGTPNVGQSITLTAACSGGGAATSWAWSGACSPANSQCTASVGAAGPQTYSVVVSNNAGPGTPNPASTTVQWVAGGGTTAPTGCTASASPAGPLAAGGGATTVSVTCSGGSSPTSLCVECQPRQRPACRRRPARAARRSPSPDDDLQRHSEQYRRQRQHRDGRS